MSSVIGFSENLRIEMAVPRKLSGGTMTLTRLPSGRRASASGVVWSTRRPTLLTIRWAIWNRCSSSRNWMWASSSLPLLSTKVWSGPLTMMSLIVGSDEQFLERPETEQFVDQHLFQRELLAPVEVDLELAQHFGNDRAEFLGELVLAERCRGFGIDSFEQARKHLFLDAVDRGFEAFDLARALFAAAVLALVEAVHRAGGARLRRRHSAMVGRGRCFDRISSTGGNWSPPRRRPSSDGRHRSSCAPDALPPSPLRLPNAFIVTQPFHVWTIECGE